MGKLCLKGILLFMALATVLSACGGSDDEASLTGVWQGASDSGYYLYIKEDGSFESGHNDGPGGTLLNGIKGNWTQSGNILTLEFTDKYVADSWVEETGTYTASFSISGSELSITLSGYSGTDTVTGNFTKVDIL